MYSSSTEESRADVKKVLTGAGKMTSPEVSLIRILEVKVKGLIGFF